MISSLIAKVFGAANERRIRTLACIVARINELEVQTMALFDTKLYVIIYCSYRRKRKFALL